VTFLLEHGADFEIADKDGVTPLHASLEFQSSSEVANILLKAGANSSVLDSFGRSPQYISAIFGCPDIWMSLFPDSGKGEEISRIQTVVTGVNESEENLKILEENDIRLKQFLGKGCFGNVF
jgi:ankyrin repeat protein